MGVPDFLTNTQVQEAINQALGATDFLSEEDIARMIAQQTDQINALMPDLSGVLSQEQIQQMIANAQMQGMTEDQILKMIQEATGGQMSDDAIRELIAQTIADATAGVPGMDEIQRMIDEGLANGLSPEQINQMIAEYLASNPMEGITAETVQQMIADAIAAAGGGESGEGGMSMEDIQALLDSGYMTADQINALMSDAGYLGQEGVDSSVQAALDAALGEGGAINSAIAAAMQSQGGGQTPPTDTDMNFTQPYTPGSFPTNPYGEVNPYALMQGQFAGTTPYSGGATTGAEMPTGLGTLNLGDPSQYNFDIPTTPGADLYPSGIDPRYFNPPTPNRRLPEPPTTPPKESGYRLPPDFFNTYGG
jgi:DNA-binding transcriptional regulator YhcF (GntR family)